MKKVLGVLGSVVKGAAGLVGGDIVTKAAEVIDAISGKAETDPELQKLLENSKLEMARIGLADAEGARLLIREAQKSEDAFVRRARPTFLYLFYVVMIFNFMILPLLAGFGGLGVEIVQLDAEGLITTDATLVAETIAVSTFVYPDLPDQLYWLFGTSFLGLVGVRSWDKKNKLKNGEKKL